MTKTVITLVVGILLGATAARLYGPSPEEASAEPVENAIVTLPELPEPYYTVLFENDAVRVVDHRLAPGESEPEHTHAPMVGYFIQGGTLMLTEADGSTTEVTLPSDAFGEGTSREWWTHSLENVGDVAFHSILVEFKDVPPPSP